MPFIFAIMATEEAASTEGTDSEKSPGLAALISFFIPGLGHYWAGNEEHGLYIFLGTAIWYIVMFVGFFLLFGWAMAFATPLVHIGAALHAFITLKE